MGEQRRRYDRAFKNEAVKLVTEGGRTVAEAARNLGIHENLLHKWKKQYEEDSEHAFPGKGRLKPQDEALRKLQRELADVREERDILKKALAIFSKGPK
jgi:transposase